MADNKEILIEKLQRKVRKLEATLKIVANHSGKTENRMQKEFEVISETIPVPMPLMKSYLSRRRTPPGPKRLPI